MSAFSTELKNYPNALKLLKLAVTLPGSCATCEHAFSAMRRVKNCCKQLTADIDVDKIVDEFVSGTQKPRRIKRWLGGVVVSVTDL